LANVPPTANAGGPYTGTTGNPVSFEGSFSEDSDGFIVSYAWAFGDGGTGTGETPSHTYAADGVYTVTLTVTDNDAAASTPATTTATIGTIPDVIFGDGFEE
jgi:PKD repeat protein